MTLTTTPGYKDIESRRQYMRDYHKLRHKIDPAYREHKRAMARAHYQRKKQLKKQSIISITKE